MAKDKMSLERFAELACKEARARLGIPSMAWGDWTHVYFPGGAQVTFSGRCSLSRGCWVVRDAAGKIVLRSDSRSYAIGKAAKQ